MSPWLSRISVRAGLAHVSSPPQHPAQYLIHRRASRTADTTPSVPAPTSVVAGVTSLSLIDFYTYYGMPTVLPICSPRSAHLTLGWGTFGWQEPGALGQKDLNAQQEAVLAARGCFVNPPQSSWPSCHLPAPAAQGTWPISGSPGAQARKLRKYSAPRWALPGCLHGLGSEKLPRLGLEETKTEKVETGSLAVSCPVPIPAVSLQ